MGEGSITRAAARTETGPRSVSAVQTGQIRRGCTNIVRPPRIEKEKRGSWSPEEAVRGVDQDFRIMTGIRSERQVHASGFLEKWCSSSRLHKTNLEKWSCDARDEGLNSEATTIPLVGVCNPFS